MPDETSTDLAQLDRLASRLEAAVPDVSSLPASSVSFSDGKALRRGEALSNACKDVANQIAATVAPGLNPSHPQVFLTSNGNILPTVLGYRWLMAEADSLASHLRTATSKAEESVQSRSPAPIAGAASLPAGEGFAEAAGILGSALAGPVGVIGEVVAKAATQVASLFELKVAVADDEAEVPNLTMQAAIGGALLALKEPSPVQVVLESPRVPGAKSPAMTAVLHLIRAVVEGTTRSMQLADVIAKGEQGTAELQSAQRDLAGAIASANSFLARVTTAPNGGPCPLALAVAAEPFVEHPDMSVLFVGPARSEASQVTVTRRIFAPRLQTNVNVAVDYLLIDGERVRAAGHAVGSGGYHGKVTGSGTKWHAAAELS